MEENHVMDKRVRQRLIDKVVNFVIFCLCLLGLGVTLTLLVGMGFLIKLMLGAILL